MYVLFVYFLFYPGRIREETRQDNQHTPIRIRHFCASPLQRCSNIFNADKAMPYPMLCSILLHSYLFFNYFFPLPSALFHFLLSTLRVCFIFLLFFFRCLRPYFIFFSPHPVCALFLFLFCAFVVFFFCCFICYFGSGPAGFIWLFGLFWLSGLFLCCFISILAVCAFVYLVPALRALFGLLVLLGCGDVGVWECRILLLHQPLYKLSNCSVSSVLCANKIAYFYYFFSSICRAAYFSTITLNKPHNI